MRRFSKGIAMVVAAVTSVAAAEIGFTPGAAFKDFVLTMKPRDSWRVTNPDAVAAGPKRFLPNQVLGLRGVNLDPAKKAEVIIDYWGGHPGTTKRQFRINNQDWMEIPYPAALPSENRPKYMFQSNPVIPVPLDMLRSGTNKFEGTCSHERPDAWGQFGWYSARVRLQVDPLPPAATGEIASPQSGQSIGDSPTIEAISKSRNGIERIDFIAFYDGYDVAGDGIGERWHYSYNCGIRNRPHRLLFHVGTLEGEARSLTWDTRWIPDQKEGGIKLVAHMVDTNGVTCVTPVVDNLTFKRTDRSVKLHSANDVPPHFWVRAGQKRACTIEIPSLKNAKAALLHLRTWNAYNNEFKSTPVKINDWETSVAGRNHDFSYDKLEFPVTALKEGVNKVEFTSDTKHHGCEILWPGPAIAVEFSE